MEFKGTPGAWSVDDNGVFFEITRYDGLRVGDVCSSQHLYDDSKHHGNGVAYANACLIAAAPELLEALIEISEMQKLNYGDGMTTHIKLKEMVRKADLAIAKALGETK